MTTTVEARFWKKVNKTPGCWLWTASICSDGYGRFSLDGKSTLAHRAAYRLAVGEIPSGLQLDHLCRNRACVNPKHLEPVTQLENIRRGNSPSMLRRRSDTCSKGHEFTPENTTYTSDGCRRCRECVRSGCREAAWRKKPKTCPCGKSVAASNYRRHLTSCQDKGGA